MRMLKHPLLRTPTPHVPPTHTHTAHPHNNMHAYMHLHARTFAPSRSHFTADGSALDAIGIVDHMGDVGSSTQLGHSYDIVTGPGGTDQKHSRKKAC